MNKNSHVSSSINASYNENSKGFYRFLKCELNSKRNKTIAIKCKRKNKEMMTIPFEIRTLNKNKEAATNTKEFESNFPI